MRISESTIVAGYFWLPTSPQEKLGGTLHILDGGKVQIEVAGNFDRSFADFPSMKEIPRILGKVERLGAVTLDNCIYTKKNMTFGGIGKSILYCHRAFARVHIESIDPPQFKSVSFQVEGLDEWLGITGIKYNINQDRSGFSLTYEPISLPVIDLGDGFVLKFDFSYTLPGSPILTEATIRQKAYIIIESSSLTDFDLFVGLIHKIVKFLGFATDKIVSIRDLEALDDPRSVANIKVFYQSLPFSRTEPEVAWYNQLFRYQDIGKDPSLCIRAWMQAHQEIGPSLDLYFAAISDTAKYVDSKFLFLAQALETWHRGVSNSVEMNPDEFKSIVKVLVEACPAPRREWLNGRLAYANEISLAKRLAELLDPFEAFLPNGQKLKRFIRNVVDTRNYLTHYNPSLEGRAARERDLFDLAERMEAFLKLLILSRIGFSIDQINSLTKENSNFQHKMGTS